MTVAERGGAPGTLFIEAHSKDTQPELGRKQRIDLIFKALADCTRRQILYLLRESSQSVSAIVEHFHLTQPSISRHLAILRSAGLVAFDRQGQRMIYRLGEPEPMELAVAFLAELQGQPKAARPNGRRANHL